MKVRRILAAAAVAAIASAAVAATASAYNAYLAWQTTPYSFRNGWTDGSYGAATPYFNKAIVWGNSTDLDQTFPEHADSFDWDIEGYAFDVNYTDAVVNADGTYTVSMDGFDWSIDGASAFNLIQISTDFPVDGSVVVTEASVIVDGVVTATIADPVWEGDEYMTVNLCNIWNSDVAAYNGAHPTESLAIEFTVEGIGGGDVVADEPADTGAVDTGAATTDSKGGSPETGVEGVAAVAGLAVVAGGAMLLSKKRK